MGTRVEKATTYVICGSNEQVDKDEAQEAETAATSKVTLGSMVLQREEERTERT